MSKWLKRMPPTLGLETISTFPHRIVVARSLCWRYAPVYCTHVCVKMEMETIKNKKKNIKIIQMKIW